MKPKVLLIQESPRRPKFYINKLPPLGLLGVASFIERGGIPVKIIDRNIEPKVKIAPEEFDVFGFSINLGNISSSLDSIRYLKKLNPRAKIVVGGASCTSNPVFFTNNEYIDAICVGEGEQSFFDYLLRDEAKDKENIKGMYIKGKGNKFIYSGDREYIKNLDGLPFVALDKVDLSKYFMPLSRGVPISSINTSRGCPYKCSFCFHSMGHAWRFRSPENVTDEIEWQVKGLGVKELCIEDDNFLLDLERAERIIDLIIKREIKVNIQLHNGIRIENINRRILEKMKQAGVWLIAICPETGSPKIMEQINKKVDKEKTKEIIDCCRNIGIKTYVCFIFGFPFETRQDIMMSTSFINRLSPDILRMLTGLPRSNRQ